MNKNLILFYPSFERGGVEKILKNLIQKNKKFKITLISSKSAKKVINLKKINFIEVTQKIKIPFIENSSSLVDGFNVWVILLMTFTLGVVLGFVISLIQMISLKGETITLKSKNKKIQIELDALRNQGIDDELEMPDDINQENFTL